MQLTGNPGVWARRLACSTGIAFCLAAAASQKPLSALAPAQAPTQAPVQAQVKSRMPAIHGHEQDHARAHGPDHGRAGTAGAPAQIVDGSHLGSPLVLDHGWRVGITSNPWAAQPDFDDSQWAERNAADSIADVSDPDEEESHPHPGAPVGPADATPAGRGQSAGDAAPHGKPPLDSYAWFRLHIQLAPHHGPIALLILLPVSRTTTINFGSKAISLDVYANGQPVLPTGPHSANQEDYQPISRIYPLDIPDGQTSLLLAARMPNIPYGQEAYTGFFGVHTLKIGNPADLAQDMELWQTHNLFERLPTLIDALLRMVLTLFLFALFWTQRGHWEYLWLGLHLLAEVPMAFIELAGNSAQLPRIWFFAAMLQLVAVSAYFYLEFLISFLALRKRWFIQWLRCSAPVMLLLGPSLILTRGGKADVAGIVFLVSGLISLLWILGWLAFVFLTLAIAALRKNFEAALLLLPLLLGFVGVLEPVSSSAQSSLGGAVHSPLTIPAGPIPIHFNAISDFVGIFVIVLIIFVRFLRIHRDRERAASELAAARSVQELMIPAEAPQTPGFSVDTIYNPANEVGGDFYHIHPLPRGELLVVIGDVAGKGLQAAMNVSMLMGALRAMREASPGAILSALNKVLVGSASFTTCEAAYFQANGEVVLASAGHLPPYLNSQEVAVPGGLPLGVVPDVTYEEIRLYLHPGDRLLLLSDGVVEAQKPNGELFGFDRVRNLSNQSAFYIADAAKDFGQEDDITVLTVQRVAVAA